MWKSGQFSMKSFPLQKCFDCDTVSVILMPEKANKCALMAFDYLDFIALCFGFSIISNSNNFLKNLQYSHSYFFFPVCSVQKCYTWNSCRLAVFFAIILHFLLSLQMPGDPWILVNLFRDWTCMYKSNCWHKCFSQLPAL